VPAEQPCQQWLPGLAQPFGQLCLRLFSRGGLVAGGTVLYLGPDLRPVDGLELVASQLQPRVQVMRRTHVVAVVGLDRVKDRGVPLDQEPFVLNDTGHRVGDLGC